jgi:hypothetical protein
MPTCRDKAEKRKKQLKAAKILEERERRQFCEERTQRLAHTFLSFFLLTVEA